MFKFEILISTLDAVKMPGSRNAIGKSFVLKGRVLGRLPSFGYYSMEDIMEKVEELFSYSRAQAIEDGVLVNVSDMAKEAGIRYPVAMTGTVWQTYVKVPDGVEGQDEDGRLWDILWMFRASINKVATGNESRFKLYVRNDNRKARLVELKAIVGPGDEGEPVITIMFPNED